MKAKRWYDDDEIWTRIEPLLFTKKHFENAKADVQNIIDLCQVTAVDPILDLACGVGRHVIEFALLGCKVTGIDRTSAYIQRAKDYARQMSVQATFKTADMYTYVAQSKYKLVVNLNSSFGYSESIDDDRLIMEHMLIFLQDTGQLLIETMGKEILARTFTKRFWREVDGTQVMHEQSIENDWSWIDSRWIIVDGNTRTEVCIGGRLYSATELKTLALNAGFRNASAFGSLSGTPYNESARRLVLVAKK